MDPNRSLLEVSGTYMFRGIEYIVSIEFTGANLIVEVEDRVTADQWRGVFDAAYIEDLTHKTGNFKQFQIFVNMLESAVKQNNESVSLDLLTYADLESLRSRKAGAGAKGVSQAQVALGTKRYLILTYTVEFDRIHYPLPLPYMGKPDPRALQERIRSLQDEVKLLKKTRNSDRSLKEVEKLRRDLDRSLKEKMEIESELIHLKRELKNTKQGSAVKEIRVLKSVIKNLEKDLMTEKNRHQKSSYKRTQDYRNLVHELDELKASERNLRVRVKSLTNELALYKRGGKSHQSRINSSSGSFSRDRSHSRDSSYSSRLSQDRSYSHRSRANTSRDKSRPHSARDRSTSRERTSFLSKDRSLSRPRSRERSLSFDRGLARSSSRERARSTSRDRPTSYLSDSEQHRSRRSDRSPGGAFRGRTPSPLSRAGTRYPRFDPSAYVKEKERKEREASLKKKREVRANLSGNSDKRRPKSSPAYSDRSYGAQKSSYTRRRKKNTSRGSYGRRRNRASSIESLSDIGVASDASEGIYRQKRNGILKNANIPSSPEISFGNKSKSAETSKKMFMSTPENDSEPRSRLAWEKENRTPTKYAEGSGDNYFERSAEINDIDARLSRLQTFMKANLPI